MPLPAILALAMIDRPSPTSLYALGAERYALWAGDCGAVLSVEGGRVVYDSCLDASAPIPRALSWRIACKAGDLLHLELAAGAQVCIAVYLPGPAASPPTDAPGDWLLPPLQTDNNEAVSWWRFATGLQADTDQDGTVTPADLALYLRRYDAGEWMADLDDGGARGVPDGGVGSEDLLYYLDCWERESGRQ